MNKILPNRIQPEWYVLYTSPRAEKKVKERLDELNVTTYLPLHLAPSVWSDRIKMVEKPLFSSYLFVWCKEYELYALLRVYGVAQIVRYAGKPAVIRQREIDAIRRFLEEAAEHPLCEGEEVEILTGALKKISGKVRRIKKKYLLLYIEQLGATVAVDLLNVARLNRIR
ncbi:MAG: UpxY family transcription antiterminator [Tannerella sp.]|jgi:transcription antitermination factor NusG|nr:UpxY family transcription antiterminator [Tannerella sp.]